MQYYKNFLKVFPSYKIAKWLRDKIFSSLLKLIISLYVNIKNKYVEKIIK